MLRLLAWMSDVQAELAPLLKDGEISAAIDRSLAGDPIVPHDRIQVSATGGIVTLSGVVGNLLAQERAVEHAESIKGVRAVVHRLKVLTVSRPDEELMKNVQEALRVDSATESLNVNVSARDGQITISGSVQSWAEKELATDAAKSVKGVSSIRNLLMIEPQAGREDREIEADIKRRFQSDVWLMGRALDVGVVNGVVRLEGTVGSALEKSRATTLAYVLGITRVETDGLTVEWSPDTRVRRSAYGDRTDDDITRALQDAFRQDPRLSAQHPTVQVRAGSVTLKGSVDNLAAKRAAEHNARHTVGVRTVNNYLKVMPTRESGDDTIGDRVRLQLSENPIVDRFDIAVSVQNGVVSLNGVVDHPIEQQTAEEVVGRVPGVVKVTNRLEVNAAQLGRSDEELQSSIRDQLWWSPFVDEDQVHVEVRQRVVTLTGTVDTLWEKKWAEENALEGGARVVKNYLKVAFE